jgi:hypothetical protein
MAVRCSLGPVLGLVRRGCCCCCRRAHLGRALLLYRRAVQTCWQLSGVSVACAGCGSAGVGACVAGCRPRRWLRSTTAARVEQRRVASSRESDSHASRSTSAQLTSRLGARYSVAADGTMSLSLHAHTSLHFHLHLRLLESFDSCNVPKYFVNDMRHHRVFSCTVPPFYTFPFAFATNRNNRSSAYH